MKAKSPRSLGEDAAGLKQRLLNEEIRTRELWIKIGLEIGRRRAQKWNHELEKLLKGSSPERAPLRQMLEDQIDRYDQELRNLVKQKEQVNNMLEEISFFEAMAEQGNLKGLKEELNRMEEAVNSLYARIKIIQSADD